MRMRMIRKAKREATTTKAPYNFDRKPFVAGSPRAVPVGFVIREVELIANDPACRRMVAK